jgi:hypothetical protein
VILNDKAALLGAARSAAAAIARTTASPQRLSLVRSK